MSKPLQDRDRTSGIRRRITSAALALAVLLGPTVIATRPVQAQTFTVIHTFTGGVDGSGPFATLIDVGGKLYGTTAGTAGGGVNGTVFEMNTKGQEFVLHGFRGARQGRGPYAGLVQDAAGNLYGTTVGGGTAKLGTVFQLSTTGAETVLHSFAGGADGSTPYAGLVMDPGSNLYGTTNVGGPFGYGTVFKVDSSGNETVLYSFTGGADGGYPGFGSLIIDAAGNLYGTTEYGGTSGGGTVYKVDSSDNETVLYSFTGTAGSLPTSALVRDKDGNLYGTTSNGGSNGAGTVFELDTSGNETVLHTFTAGADGIAPIAGLVRDPEGNLYGTTKYGGAFDSGTVFEVSSGGIETVLHAFDALTDGAYPYAGLVRDSAGNLYGTAISGGSTNDGTVFEVTP